MIYIKISVNVRVLKEMNIRFNIFLGGIILLFKTKLELLIFIICVMPVMAISNLNYFNIKYNKKLFGVSGVRTQDFYTKYINTFTLIFIAIELNNFGGMYTYISFILTYIICAKLDRLYREKFEKILKQGDKEIQKYLKKNQRLTLKSWLNIKIKCFKNGYEDSLEVFKFKFKLSVVIIMTYILLKNFNIIAGMIKR